MGVPEVTQAQIYKYEEQRDEALREAQQMRKFSGYARAAGKHDQAERLLDRARFLDRKARGRQEDIDRLEGVAAEKGRNTLSVL
jgi:hypothetical protein